VSITINLPAILARHAGGLRSHVVQGATVGEALGQVTRDYPELGRRLVEATAPDNAFVTIYLNDEDARHLNGLATPIRDGDDISVVSAIAGG
jgi:molybdopterin synthase sulfur carrier subunit